MVFFMRIVRIVTTLQVEKTMDLPNNFRDVFGEVRLVQSIPSAILEW